MLTEWPTEGSRNYGRTAYRTECHTTLPEDTKWPLTRQRIFCPSCLPRWPPCSRLRTHRSYHPNDFHREMVQRDPSGCRIKRCQDLQIKSTKRLSETWSRLLLRWVWSPTGKLACWIRINDIPPTPMQFTSILPPSNCHRECYMRTTVTMLGAEDHIAVQSQDEIHVMIDYFTDITLANSDDAQCLESTLRSKSRTELCVESERLQLQSRIPNESQFQFGDPSYILLSHNGNRESIWWRNRRPSNEFSNREIAVSTWSNPTDKSKHTERQSTETHREVDRDVYREVDQDSTEAAYRE